MKGWQGSKWIRREKRLAIYLRDRFTCLYCGRGLWDAKPQEINLDHLCPRSKGGNNDPYNLVTSCKACNLERGCKPWHEYAPGGAVERIRLHIHRELNMELAKSILIGCGGTYDR